MVRNEIHYFMNTKEMSEEEFYNKIFSEGKEFFIGKELVTSHQGVVYHKGIILDLKTLRDRFVVIILNEKGERQFCDLIGKPFANTKYSLL